MDVICWSVIEMTESHINLKYSRDPKELLTIQRLMCHYGITLNKKKYRTFYGCEPNLYSHTET